MEARLDEGSLLEGKYRIVRVIGRGGMGVVYEAEHLFLKRRCAVKVLAPTRADDEVMLTRFKTEARSAANIVHPNVVEVLDFGVSPEGLPFFVMEYLEGESLGERIKRLRRLPPAVAVEFTDQILRALSKAHKLGVVHRDLKPDNIFITRIDEVHEAVKVLDFGIVKLMDTYDAGIDTTGTNRPMTMRGVVLGTPGYIAPESIFGLSNIDGRADLFSVGVLLYVMLTGKRPFTGENAHDILVATLSNPPTPPRALRPELSEAMEKLVLIALAKNPSERFATAGEFLSYLTAAAVGRIPDNGRPVPSSTTSPWSASKHPSREGSPASADIATRSLSRPQIALDISELLRATPDESLTGGSPVSLDSAGRVSSYPERSGSSFSDTALGSIDSLDLSFDPNSPPRASVDEPRSSRGEPLVPKGASSGLELDIDKIRSSGVPLPSWRPTSNSKAPQPASMSMSTSWKTSMESNLKQLWREAKRHKFFSPSVQRIAIVVLTVAIGAWVAKRAYLWMVTPQVVVSPFPRHGSETSLLPALTQETAPATPAASPWDQRTNQVTIWLDSVPHKVKVTWGGQEILERPLIVPKGTNPVDVVISAPGHRAARLQVTPDHEQSLRVELESLRGRKLKPTKP